MAHVGQRFVHQHFLDPDWKPGPGERYIDAPHAEMEVTRVTVGTVWYRYADGTNTGWAMERWRFDVLYPDGREEDNDEPRWRYTGGLQMRMEDR